MAIEWAKIGEQSLALWRSLSRVRQLLAGLVLVALVAGIGYLSLAPSREEYGVLFSELAPDDAERILENLRASKTPYRLSAEGTTIEVPKTSVHEMRIGLASQGVPLGGGVGFEVFDRQSFGTTSFVEQMNYRRALAGELSRTIGSLDAVESARVHIAMKERSLYRKNDSPPSASVVIRMKRGRSLDRTQVAGVVNLVASSVEGLSARRVTVVDDEGSVLWSGDGDHAPMEAQRDIEQRLARRAREIVERVVGPNNSVVVVTVELDTAHTERTEELYDRDGAALRSEAVTEERLGRPGGAGVNAGGVAGVRGNMSRTKPSDAVEIVDDEPSEGASDSAAVGGADETEPSARLKVASTRNFEVSRVVSHVKGPKAKIGRLHVAVLVNETPAPTASSTASVAGERGPPDLEKLAVLLREATGLDPSRGDRLELRSMPFVDEREVSLTAEVAAPPGWLESVRELLHQYDVPPWVLLAVPAGTAALVVLMFFVLVLRGRRRRRERETAYEVTAEPMTAQEMEDALAEGGSLAAGHGALALPEPTPRERAIAAVRANPELAARVLAIWVGEVTPGQQQPIRGEAR
ncbi:MAG: flagellar M-ring protein FliF [Deltaproteobacteria bacterium]|nr:flagellar M-ring protein FliF [Deltaproteobacteria bacterium]